jgi:hypothetical protein
VDPALSTVWIKVSATVTLFTFMLAFFMQVISKKVALCHFFVNHQMTNSPRAIRIE